MPDEPARVGVFDVALPEGPSDAPRCVVLVFGWVGSSPRLLRNYTTAFLATGHVAATYATTAPTVDVFLARHSLRALARSALTLLQTRHPGVPAVLAYYSNGGAFVHVELLALLREDAASSCREFAAVRVCGKLFDSAPAYLTAGTAARALTEGIRDPTGRAVAHAAALLVMPPLLLLLGGLDGPQRYWRALAADELACPSLYIYSEHDELTDAGRLDELIASLETANPQVEYRRLRIGREEAVSEHVRHLGRHPERYVAAVTALLRDAAGTV